MKSINKILIFFRPAASTEDAPFILEDDDSPKKSNDDSSKPNL